MLRNLRALKNSRYSGRRETGECFRSVHSGLWVTPFGKPRQEEISKGIDQFNATNRAITEKVGVTYINITDLTRKGLEHPEYVAEDGLHPSGKMYTLWVERMLPVVLK